MKKIAAILLMIALTAAFMTAPAEAGKKKKARKMEVRYENPMLGAAGTGICVGCPGFASGPKEFFIKAEIVDDVSPVGYVDIAWDADGDGTYDTSVTVCGATESAVEIPPSTGFVAFPSAVPSPFCVGSSTAGTIKLTFSATP